jgi:beta-ketodecanoyl-[acyl-carrier-protein] synthase
MTSVVISGTGLYHPLESISNEELVASFNAYVDLFNKENERKISQGSVDALAYSDANFIEKASGIKSRYVIDKKGILDPNIMHPVLKERVDSELSLQAEMAVNAAKQAFEKACVSHKEIDAVIVACSNMQRPYPAMAIEVQHALKIDGFAYDMNVACSSATFALQMAESLIKANHAKTVLIVTPEICSAHLNFRDRDSHFIFGDVATAMIVQDIQQAKSDNIFKIIDSKLQTTFSNNIRNNSGFMNRLTAGASELPDKYFYQNGRKVFKEVITHVLAHLRAQLEALNLAPQALSSLWLHQANVSMNRLISSKLMGRELSQLEAPIILDRFANTAAAGSIIAFHEHQASLMKDQLGLLCSFGAGYSIGSLVLKKM